MTSLIKGLLIVAAGTVAVCAVKKLTEKKFVDENGNKVKKEDPKFIKDMKEHATKKAMDILGFVADHEKEVKGATLALGVIAAGLKVVVTAKKLQAPKPVSQPAENLDQLIKKTFPTTFNNIMNFDEKDWCCVGSLDVDDGVVRFYEPKEVCLS